MSVATRRALVSWLYVAALGALSGNVPAVAAGSAPCTTAMLSLRVESGAGRFSGMSHDGAIAILRNVGTTTCELPPLPELSLRDARGSVVASGAPRGARLLHPGPVAFPLALGAGQIAATTLRWITGNVFGSTPARRVVAASLSVTLGGHVLTTPLAATVWGQAGEPLTFAQDRFTTSLPPLGAISQPVVGTFVGEGPAGSTYVYGLNHPARRLRVSEAPAGTLRFFFDGIGGAAPSTGEINGPLTLHDGRATFDDVASDCHLSISFHRAQLAVRQFGSCGFGNGVTAAGQYRLL